MGKKSLLLVVPHMPAFDSCVPLMIRLHQRGVIHPRVILGPRLRQVEPRAEQALRTSGIDYANKSLLGMEVMSGIDIARADAVLTHSDPLAFGGKFRPRDSFIRRLKKPVFFIQHGMIQQGLHVPGPHRDVWEYYAKSLLIWAPLPDARADFLAPTVADRLHVTGITKTNLLGPWPDQAQVRAEFAPYDARVLICHNFGFEPERYGMDMFHAALEIWQQAASAQPKTAFILRGHRGKRHPDIEDKIANLCASCPNIIRSERHHGLTAMATIHDVMAVVDGVISHPSTVILDAAYDAKPVAVMNGQKSMFATLPAVDHLDDFMAFVQTPAAQDGGHFLRETYGNISTNLDKAAQVIEDSLNTHDERDRPHA